MITIVYISGGLLVGFIIGFVATVRGHVIAAFAVTRTRQSVVWAMSSTHLHLLEPHKGHHTPRYQRIHAALADTQQWPAVTR